MNNFVDFIEKHKGGILITLGVHIALFLYFQLDTYQEKINFDNWEFSGRNIEAPDDIEITVNQIETPQEQELYDLGEVKNAAKDLSSTTFSETTASAGYALSASENTQSAKDYEQSVKEALAEGKEAPSFDDFKTNYQKTENAKTSTEGYGKQVANVKGETMIQWKLSGRKAIRLRNPGYTCAYLPGKSMVVVDIKVGIGGQVISAKYNSARSSNASECMIEKAQDYASKSKFNYAADAPKVQSGTITYIFVYKK